MVSQDSREGKMGCGVAREKGPLKRSPNVFLLFFYEVCHHDSTI
jgi:hypothetical protein